MRKSFIAIIICLIFFLQIGCAVDPPTFYFNPNELLEDVIKIQLIECENDNPRKIIVNDNSTPYFDINSIELIEELPSDKVEDFIYELSTVTFHIESTSVNSPIGYAVLIYNENGEIIVISCTVLNDGAYSMVAKFSAEGKFIELIAQFADEPKYRMILEKYFTIKNNEEKLLGLY